MPPDILSGDYLAVGGEEYPVKAVSVWSLSPGQSAAFRQLARLDALTKRAPAMAGGKRGAAEIHLAGLKCTPFDPVDPETRQRLALDTPHTLLQTFVCDADGYVHLILEDLKR